jgi:hypothetical protein
MARQATSLIERIQAEGRRFLGVIEAEIHERQSELEHLRAQASQWLAAIGGEKTKGRRGRPPGRVASAPARPGRIAAVKKPGRPKRNSPAVDWEAVLKRLPKDFTMAQLERATPKLKEHRQTRNIALARWSRAGAIKKVGAGKYRKAGKS